LANTIRDSKGTPLQLKVQRDGKTFQVSVTPQLIAEKTIFGDEVHVGKIGIGYAGTTFTERFDPFTAVYKAAVQSWQFTELTVLSIVKIFEGKISAKTIGGPILIAQLAGQQAKAGALSLLFLMAIISINLAILNVLPIPVLDGGHLMMFLIEAVTGKPVSLRLRERAQQIGIFIILLLMLLVFYNDLARIVTPQ
jgi:regulator of sigma E protease